MVVEFINDKEWGIEKAPFTSLIKRLQGAVDCHDGILNVVFVNDTYIKALNKKYRDKDEPTDVLSFNYEDENTGEEDDLIGEIYISIDTTKRQAKEHKQTLEDELNKLFVHGFLHIYGYDHEEDKDYKKMLALEEKILG